MVLRMWGEDLFYRAVEGEQWWLMCLLQFVFGFRKWRQSI